MLECIDLSYIHKQKQLLFPTTLHFLPGRLYGILGPNGAGKSTFLKTFGKIWKPASGHVLWDGQLLHTLSRPELSSKMTLVPQNPFIPFDYNVYELVNMAGYARDSKLQKEEVQNYLEAVNAAHLSKRRLSQLSGGELQRVYIARALATRCPILLLDEPTAHLDIKHKLEVMELLRRLSTKERFMILALHDLQLAHDYCDELVLFKEGRHIKSGEAKTLFSDGSIQELFDLSLETKLIRSTVCCKTKITGS